MRRVTKSSYDLVWRKPRGCMRRVTKSSYDLVWRKPMKTSYEVIQEKLPNCHTISYEENQWKHHTRLYEKIIIWPRMKKSMKTSYVENLWNSMQDKKNGETLTQQDASHRRALLKAHSVLSNKSAQEWACYLLIEAADEVLPHRHKTQSPQALAAWNDPKETKACHGTALLFPL